MKQNSHKKLRRQAGTVLMHVPLAVLALVWLIPIFWVVMTSFRGNQGSYSSTVLPSSYTLGNYVKLFTDFSVFNFPKMLSNTLIVAVAHNPEAAGSSPASATKKVPYFTRNTVLFLTF